MKFKKIYLFLLLLCVLGFTSFVGNAYARDDSKCSVDPTFGTFRWSDAASDAINGGNAASMGAYIQSKVDDFTYLAWVKDTPSEKLVTFIFAGYVYFERNVDGSWRPVSGSGGSGSIVPGNFGTLSPTVPAPPSAKTFLASKKVTKVSLSYINSNTLSNLVDSGKVGFVLLNDDGTVSNQNGVTEMQGTDAKFLLTWSLANATPLEGTYNPITFDVSFSYSATFRTTHINVGNDPDSLASFMGYNLKQYSWEPDCRDNSKVMAMVMYMPFFVTYTYENGCDPVKAALPTSTEYWTKGGTARRPVYTPTQLMMDCACKVPLNAQFNPALVSRTGGSLTPKVSVAATNLKVSCDAYAKNKACTLANFNAGNLTDDEITACCKSTPLIFNGAMCPQDTTFDLYCNNKLTETKTYISPKNEISNSNTACSITSVDVGTATMKPSPFTIAGQGLFGSSWSVSGDKYGWEFLDKLYSKAVYKYTPTAWATKYNGYVTTRVELYNDYLAAKAEYDAWAARCKTTHIEVEYYDCNCSSSGTPAVRTCDTCPKNVTYCDDPDMEKSDFTSEKNHLRRVMNNAYDDYRDALDDENDFLDDKTECDNWEKNVSNFNDDFSISIEEDSVATFKMKKDSEVTEKTTFINTALYPTVFESKPLLINCSPTATVCNRFTSTRIYSVWGKEREDNYTFTYPDEAFINKITYEVSKSKPKYSYNGGYNYYTDLGTLTGRYDLNVIMNNAGFGYYKKWKLKDSKMVCWYDLENNLGPGTDDDNYPEYGNLGLAFRVVKLADLFPNRGPGSNWAEEPALVSSIETTGENLYNRTPIYTFVITPDSMKSIRSYNAKHEYTDWYDFIFSNSPGKGTSSFLKEISQYGVKMVRSSGSY